MNETRQCMVSGCTKPPTKYIEADVGLEGGLRLYYCDEHAEQETKGQALDIDASRAEPESTSVPES